MLRHKRVAMVAGLVGALTALVLPLAVTSPASAATPNTVTVTKVVNGTPTQVGNFEFLLSCGPGPTEFHTLVVPPTGGSDSVVVSDTKTNCQVFEIDTRGATSTSIQAAGSDTAAIFIPDGQDATNPIQITFDGGGGQFVNVGVTNNFAVAGANRVNVTKVVTGDAPAGAFYRVDVACGGAPSGVLFTAAGGTATAFLPPGDLGPCVVSEPVVSPPGVFVATTFGPILDDNGVVSPSFSAGGNQTRSVRVTNRYESPGPRNVITVEKRVRGEVPAPPPNQSYTVRVTCNVAPGDPFVPGPEIQNFTFGAGGGIHQFQVSKERRDCNITETSALPVPVSTDYQASVPAPSQLFNAGLTDVNLRFGAGGGLGAGVTITNRYPNAVPDNIVRVTKETVGAVPPGTLFLVQVDCGGVPSSPAADPITDDVSLLFGAGQPATQEVVMDALVGPGNFNQCEVVESLSGGAQQVVYGATSDDPDTQLFINQPPPGLGNVDIAFPFADNEVQVEVTVSNRFPNGPAAPANELRVKKRIRGDVPGAPSFTIRVRCSGGGVTDEQILTFTDQTPVDLSIPAARTNCSVKEIGGSAPTVEYRAVSNTGADATDGPNSGRIEFDSTGGQSGKVVVTNRFPGSCPAGGPKFC